MVAASLTALQHAPRPLPLFLDMVRNVAATDPVLAARALTGVRRYAAAQRPAAPVRPAISLGPLTARTAGHSGPRVVLVPSLINPSWVMDMDRERSLLSWLGANGCRAWLLDWGMPKRNDRDLDLAGHVEQRLIPALQYLVETLNEPIHVVGYCLGGVMAMAAAHISPPASLTLLATPWHFSDYPTAVRQNLSTLWSTNAAVTARLGVLPMEVLQSAFWAMDPERTVAKFAALADLADDDPQLVAFARLEDWANDGAPLTAAAGRELFEGLFRDDVTGNGRWTVAGNVIDAATIPCPAQQFSARDDRIAPAVTACRHIAVTPCPSGHVGMMVGSRARAGCWEPLLEWIHSNDR